MFLHIMDLGSLIAFPAAGEELVVHLIEMFTTGAIGEGMGHMPGGEFENPELPETPEELGESFHPVVLGFDTALYQATGKGEARDSSNPFFSPVPPDRTATQTTGYEVVFPKGTVVWDGTVGGVHQIAVPQPDRGWYVAVTWSLK